MNHYLTLSAVHLLAERKLQLAAPVTALLLSFMLPASANAMEPLDEQEMSAIAGQEGVMVGLEYYYNSVRTSNPTTSGAGLEICANGGLGDMDCRLAWQLSGRGQAYNDIYASTTWTYTASNGSTHIMDGEWLVWKAGWSSLVVKDLMLDAATLGDAESSGAAYQPWLTDNVRPVYGSFVDSSGNCLMPLGPSDGGATCSVAYMTNMPALKTHYPGTGGTYNSGTRTTTGFEDVRFGLEVTGLSAEYDNGTQAGWQLNNGDSFTALKIADNNFENQAGIAFGGSFYLYGF